MANGWHLDLSDQPNLDADGGQKIHVRIEYKKWALERRLIKRDAGW